ncbi:MAG: polysaccharide export protein [Acidiferrobacterales bacterium]
MRKILLALIVPLSGCGLAPTMDLDESKYEGPVSFPIIPITAELVTSPDNQPRRSVNSHNNVTLERKLAEYEYRVGPQDVLSVIVWEHPELTIPAGEFRSAEAAGHTVSPGGTIFFPFVGEVDVAGKTVQEIRRLLSERLAAFITNPQLDVRVAAFNSQRVHVIGEVIKPGILPITDVPLTALEAINKAGGISPEADLQNVALTRNGEVRTLDLQALYDFGDTRQNVLLRSGDIVHVPDRNKNKVFILGEFKKPTTLLMHKGRITLAEVISDVGGFDRLTADPSRIYVIRGEFDHPEIYRLDASSADALLLANRFQLKPRDVVYVASTKLARWDRVISQILPTIQLLWFTDELTSD